ncbi:MAG: M28 family metallopeptidase [Kofleriaceae bacterium]
MRWAILLALAACSVGPPGPSLDVDRELAHITALVAIGPRPADSAAARKAASYIRTALAPIPLETTPVGDVDLPAIEVLGATFRPAQRVHVDDPDLVARFGPTGKAVLLMAHYDTVPGAPGAIDDGASVGLLIELARELHAHPPAQPVMIAFTADEEGGLVGAEALAARHGDEVELAIALDMIGGSGPLILNGASQRIGLVEMTWLARAADRAGVTVTAPLPHRVVSRWWPQAERADHGVFTRRGIRAFHLYNRGQDGLWIDTAYHSPRDVLARVDRASLDEMSRLARELVAVPPPPPNGDGFWLPLATNTVVPRWCLLAADVALALLGLLGVGALAVSGRAAGRARGAGIWLALVCFAVAGAAAAFANHPIDLDPARISLANVARQLAATSLIMIGVLGLATRVIARRLPWIGAGRYLGLASVPLLVVGLAWFSVGGAELAWIWLAPAAVLAIAPRLPRVLGLVAALFALLPAALVLRPNQVLEAAWNGFFPPGVPLAIWFALLAGPALAALAWWWRSRPTRGPLGTLVLPVGCGLSVMVGLLLEFAR